MSLRSLVILCVLAAPATARADDDKLPPMPDRGIGLAIAAHNGLLDGVEERGWGPALEVALGDNRLQYFVEGSLAFSHLGRGDATIDGKRLRGGFGVRWLARSFEIGRHGAIDMHLEGFGGVSRTRFDGMSRLIRPDFGLGVGYQVRGYWNQRKKHVALRISARLYFAPTDRDVPMTACRGTCPMSGGTDDSGMLAVFGVEL